MVAALVENGAEAKNTERRHLRAPETAATRSEVNRRAAEYRDIVDIVGKRHYPKPSTDRVVGATEGPWAPDENAPPVVPVSRNPLQADEKMTRKERPGKRMATKSKEQKPSTGVLPFESESFDGPTQSRRMFFESQFLADHYAELLGRPARVENAEERSTPRQELPLSVRRALESALPGGRGSEEVNNRIRAQVEAVVLQRYTRDLAKRYSRGDYALEEEDAVESGSIGRPNSATSTGNKKAIACSSNNSVGNGRNNSARATTTTNKKRLPMQEPPSTAAAATTTTTTTGTTGGAGGVSVPTSSSPTLPVGRTSGRGQKGSTLGKFDVEFSEDDAHMQEDFGPGSSVVSSTFLASEEASTEVPGHFGSSLGYQDVLPTSSTCRQGQQHLPTLLSQQHQHQLDAAPSGNRVSNTKETSGNVQRQKMLS
mmetsp:Transcript_5363/g.12799  ORF Transcript_5363/g.12799 Transcript_5363/m.12799 type:complete len:427 (-) Transcript_5363:96-1376(-)